MDIELKYKIVEKIIQTQDDQLLNEVKTLLGLFETDFWDETPAEVKQLINEAKDELDNGIGIAHEQVMADIKVRFDIIA